MRQALRLFTIAVGLLLIWQCVVWISGVPKFILPGPVRVAEALIAQFTVIAPHAGITAMEIVLGLLCGTVLGGISAISLILYAPLRQWLMPVLIASQALPVFALAPLLTLWFGYGLMSKVAMAVLIIYFPVTAAFYDGLRRIDPGWLDMARVMAGPNGLPRRSILLCIRLPAALPAFGSGRLLRQLLGAELEEQPDRYQRASPVTHVSAATPPFFLFHGTMDMLVPFSQAERFAEALDAQGVYHEIYRMRLRGHVTSFLTAGNAVDQAARFLARQGAGPQSAQANER